MSGLRSRLGLLSPGSQAQSGSSCSEVDDLVMGVQGQLLASYPDLIPAVSGGKPGTPGRLQAAIRTILTEHGWGAHGLSRELLASRLADEVSGYGPITPLLIDDDVDEVMVNGPGQVYVERSGLIQETDIRFRDEDHLLAVIARIVAPLGRRVDRSSPHVDGRLPDGSRVHVILPPLAIQGPILTIRKFGSRAFTLDDLVDSGSLTPPAASFLDLAVRARLNTVVAGGAGVGKTTTLNAMASLIRTGEERIITMEDAAELRITHPHVISLETRPPNLEGRGEVTMRQLLRNALRMRPDRLIMGEVRGEEAFELLQALNTGHDGCLSTVHASGAVDALRRLENMVLTAGHGLMQGVVAAQLRMALDLVVFQMRLPGGRRLVAEISLVASDEKEELLPIFTLSGRGKSATIAPTGAGLPRRLAHRLSVYGVDACPDLIGELGGWRQPGDIGRSV